MGKSSNVNVPLLDLKAQFEQIRQPVMEAIEEVCDSQQFIMGPKVERLEKLVADYCGCKFGVGVSSGTDALLVALMALDIGSGAAVITTPYTFFATGGTIARLGARPIFCDIDPETFNLSAERVAEMIEQNCDVTADGVVHRASGDLVKAIMPVHLFGQTADIAKLNQIAERYELYIVEDAAQSIGSEYADGNRAGSAGHVGCFSFFPSKNLGAFGDGGMCTTNDEALAEKIRVLRLHGGKPKYFHSIIGGNFRLDAIQAAILLVKLRFLDDWTAQRQANAQFYDDVFSDNAAREFVVLPKTLTGKRHIYNQYTIRTSRRDELREYLSKCGIGTEIYYPVPLHLQKCFEYLGYRSGDCPESERAANESLAIPVFPELNDDQRAAVANRVSEFYS